MSFSWLNNARNLFWICILVHFLYAPWRVSADLLLQMRVLGEKEIAVFQTGMFLLWNLVFQFHVCIDLDGTERNGSAYVFSNISNFRFLFNTKCPLPNLAQLYIWNCCHCQLPISEVSTTFCSWKHFISSFEWRQYSRCCFFESCSKLEYFQPTFGRDARSILDPNEFVQSDLDWNASPSMDGTCLNVRCLLVFRLAIGMYHTNSPPYTWLT